MSLISLLMSPTERARTVSCPTTSVKADISRFMRSTRSLTSDSSASARSAACRFCPDTSAISRACVDVDADRPAICAPLAASAGGARLLLRQRRTTSGLELGARGVERDLDAGLADGGDALAHRTQETIQRPCGRTERQRALRQHGLAPVQAAQQAPDAAQAEYGSGQDTLLVPARIVFCGDPLPGRAGARPVSRCMALILVLMAESLSPALAPAFKGNHPCGRWRRRRRGRRRRAAA